MKKTLLFMARLCFVVALLHLSGCNKLFDWDDYIKHPDKVEKLCPIKKIVSYGDINADTVIGTFSYTSWGAPSEVSLSFTGTGQPAFRFWYDKQHRLTDYFGVYGTPNQSLFGYEFWHRYVYVNNRAVRDTMRGLGTYPVANSEYVWLVTFEYDASDRITKTERIYLPRPDAASYIETFTYNKDGNLVKRTTQWSNDPNPFVTTFTYSDKPNLHRTNRVWMFVDKDYSVNSPVSATTYNQYGLPLKLRLSSPQGYQFLYNWNIGQSDIEYQCK